MGRASIASIASLLEAVLAWRGMVAAIVLLVSTGPAGAGAGWRAYDAGGVVFSAPEFMRPPGIDQQSPEPFDPEQPTWGFTLTDNPGAPDRGLTASFEWSSDESVVSPTTRVLGRTAFAVNDRDATRIDWLNRDMHWRGLDILVAGLSPHGQVFKASCHAPEAIWAKAGPLCDAIVATLQWRVAPAPVETNAAEPPPSQPEPATTDEALITEPPPSPIASSAPPTETLPQSAVASEPPQKKVPPPSAVPSEPPQKKIAPPGLLERATSLWSAIAAGAVLALAAVGLLAVRLQRRPRPGPPPSPKSRPRLQPPSPPEVKRFCPYCGAQVAAGARFCSACGKPMPEQE